MKNGEKYNNSRRNFLKGISATVVFLSFFQFCKNAATGFIFKLSGTNHLLGHRLHLKNFPEASKAIKIEYLIVGGGISGLSAARQFYKKGIADFLLVELENHLGGNASSGENSYSKYPLGAHYLPLPNKSNQELIDFLHEEAIIKGFDAAGFPVFDEEQLTLAPQERLFYKNQWQESLVPKSGNTIADDAEIDRFFKSMDVFRTAKGKDAKFLFDIPLVQSSTHFETRALDNLTMSQWLEKNQFKSTILRAYIDYCCRDDFGVGVDYVSAWVGIHYFAARKQDCTQGDKNAVLTWPEGNARLAHHLQKYTKGKSLKNHLVFEISSKENKAVVQVFDASTQTTTQITASKVILATPQYVNQYLLPDRKKITTAFQYAPWVLATLVVNALDDNDSFPLCWDNVIYGAKGLGYIYDQHQDLAQVHTKKVITYYCAFSGADLKKERRKMYKQSEEDWKKMVFDDLKIAHPTIESATESIEIHRIGHGMISALPGFVFGKEKIAASQTINNQIFFAHTDLVGISIFEEAFYQGIQVVNKILDK